MYANNLRRGTEFAKQGPKKGPYQFLEKSPSEGPETLRWGPTCH